MPVFYNTAQKIWQFHDVLVFEVPWKYGTVVVICDFNKNS